MNNKNLKLIGIVFLVIIILGGVLFFVLKKNDNNNLDNNNDSNIENPTNDNKYVYASSLTDDEKNKIINENSGSCKLIETVDINQEIKNLYYTNFGNDRKEVDSHLLINKLMKFDCDEGKDRVVLDFTIYSSLSSYSLNSVRINLVDANGNAIDKTSIYTQAGYNNIGNNSGLSYQYQNHPFKFTFGDSEKIGGIKKYYSTKISSYWYYEVDDQAKIDLNNLYVYYDSVNEKENVNKIKNSDYDFSYKKVKLGKGTDSVPSDVYYFFANSKNNSEDNSIKKYIHELLYDENGESLGSESFDAIAIFTNYRIEKWNGKNVLIVPYVLKNDTGLEEYAKYENMSKKYVYLSDFEGRFYSPININANLNSELYPINKEQNLEAIYILPDNYDLDSMFLVFENGINTFASYGAIKLNKLSTN